MKLILNVIKYIIILIISYLIVSLIIYIISYNIQKRKHDIYQLAKDVANKKDKLLMVIGDPLNGSLPHRYFTHKVFGPPYGYGDLCIDLNGCPENTDNSIKSKLEDIIYKFHTNSYVIYISQTLEYIDPHHLQFVLKHLSRVSNNDLFIVNMTFRNDQYSDRHQRFKRQTVFTKTPPEYDIIEYYHIDQPDKKYIFKLNN